MTVRAEHGDCLSLIPQLVAEGVVCDAVICDPPYHLTATQKRFGAVGAAPAQHGRDGAMARLSSGFMGQKWDGGDIAFRPETWATVATILRPGAFLVAFGGTRTYHRLVCAIEDAGFVIQDQIAWIFGSGFPKRRDMLKPAFEPICLAYKPGGARTMQVDECRISTSDGLGGGGNTTTVPEGWDRPYWHDPEAIEFNRKRTAERIAKAETLGRWPANVCHDGSAEVVEAFPDAPGQLYAVGPQHGDRVSVNCYGDWGPRPLALPRRDGEASAERRYTSEGATDFALKPGARRENVGSAARFFYQAKADAQDRWGSKHPTVKPIELIRWLMKLVCPPGGLFIDPFAGSGTAGVAAFAEGRSAILIEREAEYFADIEARLAHYRGEGGHSLAAKNRNRSASQGTLL